MARSPRTSPSGADDAGPSGRQLLRRRDFGIYWWSQVVSSPGTWLHNVTASVLMLTLTGSPFMVGVLNFAIFVPTLLFSLPAGALGDRLDRRHVVAVSLSAGALVAVGLTVLSATGALTPALLLVACFLIGTAGAVSKPSLSAMIPMLVPRGSIAKATALNVMQFQFGQIAGPALASLILVTATPAWGFGLNAVSYLGPVLAMRAIRLGRDGAAVRDAPHPPQVAGAGVPARSAVLEGLRHIRRSPAMPAILVTVVLTNGAVEALRTLAPTIAAGFGRPAAAGVIITGYSVGALVGLLSFSRVEPHLPRRAVLLTAFVLQAIGVTAVALAPGVWLTVLGAAPIGIGFSLSTPLLSAALQELAPDELRSRVMSVFSMAHLGMRPLFALVAGTVATLVSARAALAVFAATAALAAVEVRRRHVADPGPGDGGEGDGAPPGG